MHLASESTEVQLKEQHVLKMEKKWLQDHQSFFRILFKITAMTQNYSSQCSSLHESFGHRPKVSKSQEEC